MLPWFGPGRGLNVGREVCELCNAISSQHSTQAAYLQSHSESSLALCAHVMETELLIYVHLQRLTLASRGSKRKMGKMGELSPWLRERLFRDAYSLIKLNI